MPVIKIQLLQETTGFKGRVFADPTRTLYRELGMDIESLERTPAGQERKSYLVLGAFANATQSILVGSQVPLFYRLEFFRCMVVESP